MPWIAQACFACCLVAGSGCFDPKPVVPKYSAAEVAAEAMNEYDTNKDGKLDEKELARCPALKSALAELDKDGDKAISKEELESALNDMLKSKIGTMSVLCKVRRGGEPLSDAEVSFIPEKFHGASLKPGSGKSDIQGNVVLHCEGQPFPGLSPGFYRVEVSLKDAGGKETIPAQYNTQTKLGFFVFSHLRGMIRIAID
jgi:Ca2+-binding EF-hand superfamily protein